MIPSVDSISILRSAQSENSAKSSTCALARAPDHRTKYPRVGVVFVGNRPPKAALTGRSGCDAQLRHLHEQVPGQQLFDLIDGMIGDALEDVTQVAFGVEIVEFRGTE